MTAKRGFTLAEILVTLGIIGIVAALTFPTLANNWQRKSYVTQLHKVYNEFKESNVDVKDLVYFYLSGNMVNVSTTINGRSLKWISAMRCCNKAQWEIRKIANDMVEEAKFVSPLKVNAK